MSTEIVTDICPPPEWNLTAEDIHEMVDALEETYQIYQPAFERSDQAAHGWVYLKGLLSDLPRKVTERIALRFGENVRSLQHFIGQSPWSCEPLLKIHQGLVVETLGEADGVLLIDESGMVKQGEHSVGVGWQWCGSVGKVANSQVGVYLGYASRKGHSFLDARLFLPEQWFAETHQEKAPGLWRSGRTELSDQARNCPGTAANGAGARRIALSMGGGGRIVWRFACFSGWRRGFGQVVFRRSQLFEPYLVGETGSPYPCLERPWPQAYPPALAQSGAEVAACGCLGPATACTKPGYEPRSKKAPRDRWSVILPVCV